MSVFTVVSVGNRKPVGHRFIEVCDDVILFIDTQVIVDPKQTVTALHHCLLNLS